MHAAVDFLADSQQGGCVDDTWCAAARAEGITQVRAALTADAAGHVNWALAAQGAGAWGRAGVRVDVVCAYEYLPPFVDEHGRMHYPNEPVGTGTHRLTTPYVERYRLQLEAHGKALLAAGIQGIYAWNEPQVGLVRPGDNCPPGTRLIRDSAGNPLSAAGAIVPWRQAATVPDPGLNRSCLDATAYAALVWQTCHSLEHIGCRRRIAGAFNVLPQSGLDAQNPYVLGYLRAVYAHLASCGVRPNWTHLGLTCEGYWTVASALKMRDAFRAVMDAHGDHAELVIGEWGVRNRGADLERVYQTGVALETVFGAGNAAAFMRPGLIPYMGPVAGYTDYGWESWRQIGARFIKEGDYPIAPALHRWLAT